MKLFYQFSLAALAVALVAVPESASAQRRDDDVRRSRAEIERDGRWDDRDVWDDDRDDDRARRNRDVRPGRRVGQDQEWLRKHRAKREEWCRRHRDDRRCDDLYRRGTGQNQNWCWDTNRDGRCDNVDNRRRDSRSSVIRDRSRDRGPEWDRWLRANGVNIGSMVPIPVPR